ncbi:hypothetical protein [Actinotignum urinale]|uniref:hypothetical protein n=1 Tax=Actinotignum urinale TaxID=190146 RepID=UPI00370CFE32
MMRLCIDSIELEVNYSSLTDNKLRLPTECDVMSNEQNGYVPPNQGAGQYDNQSFPKDQEQYKGESAYPRTGGEVEAQQFTQQGYDATQQYGVAPQYGDQQNPQQQFDATQQFGQLQFDATQQNNVAPQYDESQPFTQPQFDATQQFAQPGYDATQAYDMSQYAQHQFEAPQQVDVTPQYAATQQFAPVQTENYAYPPQNWQPTYAQTSHQADVFDELSTDDDEEPNNTVRSILIGLIVVLLVAAAGIGGYFFMSRWSDDSKPSSQQYSTQSSKSSKKSEKDKASDKPTPEKTEETQPTPEPTNRPLTESQKQVAVDKFSKFASNCLNDPHFAPAGCTRTLFMEDPGHPITKIRRTIIEQPKVVFRHTNSGTIMELSGGTLRIEYEERWSGNEPWRAGNPIYRYDVFNGVTIPVTDTGNDVVLDFSNL